jgi:hypothetical protein
MPADDQASFDHLPLDALGRMYWVAYRTCLRRTLSDDFVDSWLACVQ